MIPTTESGAYQEMCARVRLAASGADMVAAVGYAPEVRYVDTQYQKQPPTNKLWFKIGVVQAGEKTRTLGRPARVTYHGLLSVQLFVPISDTDAANRGRKVSNIVLSSLQESTPSVDFYKPGIKDMPQADGWFYKRIFATYNFAQYQGSSSNG